MDIKVRILAFVMGLLAVLLNKQLGKLTGRWQILTLGTEFGHWTNRVPYLIVGSLAMIVSLINQ